MPLFLQFFWGKYSNRQIQNDIGRNCLLGHSKKIAKFLMMTFTCRSPFLNVSSVKNIFLIYKEIQMGSGAKSYMKMDFLIYEEMHKYFHHI